MKVIHLPPPTYDYGKDDSLDEYAIENARESGADVLIYWYTSGSYEGGGNALLRKNGLWVHEDLGHCSCYGPFDSTPSFESAEPLDKLWARMSGELQAETAPLFKRAARFK